MSILAVETFLVNKIKALLGNKVRSVETLPGDWDDEMLKRFAHSVPAAFISWPGGERTDAGGATEARIDARWVVLVATGHPTEVRRRTGDARQVGAYELVTVLAPNLHGLAVPGVGSLGLVNVQNLYTGSIERQALTVYALTFSLPITFELVPPDELLAPFETFAAQYDVPPITTANHPAWLAGDYSTSNPDARDQVDLPQS